MTTEASTVDSGEPRRHALIFAGGVSALVLGVCYVVITILYSVTGLVPTDTGEAWLTYLDGKAAAWWGIVGLSALTDLLFFPVAAALYAVLERFNRNVIAAGAGLLVLFAVLDLAVTQLNFASLIILSADYAAAATDAERAGFVAAANYPVSVFRSPLFAAYVLALPGIGILLISLVMGAGRFGRITGWVGITTGILGVVAVIVPLIWSEAGYVAIVTAVLTLIWVLLVGWRLVRFHA